ncbi:MAG: mechanosensitive ion channel family protein [Polyangiales bacterium]
MPDNKSVEAFLPILTTYGVRVVGVVIAIWISLKIAAALQRHVTNGLRSRKFDETLSVFFGSMLRWLVIVGAVLACLSVFGIETTSFAAVIGAAGLAIGLAFQGTLSNFAAGVMLLVFRPFKLGDFVTAGGQTGTIAEIGLFVTAFDTVDHRRIFIPNSVIGSGVIENVTHNAVRRVDIDVNVAASEDIDATRAALDKAATGVAGRNAERGHQIFLAGFGPGLVHWQVRVWCDVSTYWDVWQATVRACAYGLAQAQIASPTPAMNVSVSQAGQALPVRVA